MVLASKNQQAISVPSLKSGFLVVKI